MISYWKIIKIPFFKPQTSKADLRLYFEETKKYCRWHHCCQFSKQNVQMGISPLVSRLCGQTGCQKKRKTSRNSNFLVWCATFQSKLHKFQKTAQKMAFFSCFWFNFGRFWRFFSFDWKVAHQTKKFEFLEVFCFFWHPVCPQRRETSGAKWFWGQIPLCAFI